MKEYEDKGWCMISDRVITINTDTNEDWYENDAFYSNLYNYVRMNGGLPVIMKLSGSDLTQHKVLVRISKLARNLQFDAAGSLEIEIVTNVPPWEEPEIISVKFNDKVDTEATAEMVDVPPEVWADIPEHEPKIEIVKPKKRKN